MLLFNNYGRMIDELWTYLPTTHEHLATGRSFVCVKLEQVLQRGQIYQDVKIPPPWMTLPWGCQWKLCQEQKPTKVCELWLHWHLLGFLAGFLSSMRLLSWIINSNPLYYHGWLLRYGQDMWENKIGKLCHLVSLLYLSVDRFFPLHSTFLKLWWYIAFVIV